ncbi:flagellar hook-length control protein FliK [Vreelandella aquamarina]|uniref:flagellar hook-length control protein FliK n=1 Tax=Vreelandella aquamarina TaxID=77097 RepID=UPI0007803B30|nr:flagellar hook-length control protein FliK [Halomonas axialensis]
MNIQLLLSANPSQGSGASASQATEAQGFPTGLFRQAMLQATDPQRPMGALSNAPSPDGEQALRDFTSLLESLGIELNQEEIAELFAQLQTAEQGTPEPLIALAAAAATDNTLDMPSPALQEISSRLTLVAAFTDDAGLPSPTTTQTTSVAAIAEQLAIGKKDAIALINAYQQLSGSTGPNGSAQRPETLSQQIAALSLGNAANTDTSTQQTTSNTLAAPTMQTMATSVHVSSEAMASALASGEAAARISGSNELAFNLPSANAAPQPIAAATGASLPSSIGTPVSHPAWPSQLGQQLVQLIQRGGEQHVQMKLHPAELGPLSISLKMTEHGAQAQFLSAHAQVRQVIEQAIPQLREALAEQGISLSDTSVGEQGFSNQQEAFAQHSTGSSAGGESGVTSVEGETGTPVPVGSSIALDGRVDLYA